MPGVICDISGATSRFVGGPSPPVGATAASDILGRPAGFHQAATTTTTKQRSSVPAPQQQAAYQQRRPDNIIQQTGTYASATGVVKMSNGVNGTTTRVDSRTKFNNVKALFEQLEKQATSQPSSRHAGALSARGPPPVPPKPRDPRYTMRERSRSTDVLERVEREVEDVQSQSWSQRGVMVSSVTFGGAASHRPAHAASATDLDDRTCFSPDSLHSTSATTTTGLTTTDHELDSLDRATAEINQLISSFTNGLEETLPLSFTNTSAAAATTQLVTTTTTSTTNGAAPPMTTNSYSSYPRLTQTLNAEKRPAVTLRTKTATTEQNIVVAKPVDVATTTASSTVADSYICTTSVGTTIGIAVNSVNTRQATPPSTLNITRRTAQLRKQFLATNTLDSGLGSQDSLPVQGQSDLSSTHPRPGLPNSLPLHRPVGRQESADPMTPDETKVLLSPLSQEGAGGDGAEVSLIPMPCDEFTKRLSTCSIESGAEMLLAHSNGESPSTPLSGRGMLNTTITIESHPEPTSPEAEAPTAGETTPTNEPTVTYLSDGHFYFHITGLPPLTREEVDARRETTKITFSTRPIQCYSTYPDTEYDRRNDEVDPVAASAEYELERRVEKMDKFEVDLVKGPEGLGLNIIGMGVGADAGLEKLGIFVKSITPNGAASRDGRIQVCDQIIEVDGQSLIGVTQVYAATTLRNTTGVVKFLIGREKDVAASEVAALIKQSLELDRTREEHQREVQRIMNESFARERANATTNGSALDATDNESVTTGSDVFEAKDVLDGVGAQHPATTPDAAAAQDNAGIEALMAQLKESSSFASSTSDDLDDVEAFISSSLSTDDVTTPLPTSRNELSDLLTESLHEFPGRCVAPQTVPEPAPVATSTPTRSDRGTPVGSSSVETLSMELQRTKQMSDRLESLLQESNTQLTDVQRKYLKARKLIKDFQDREKQLEGTHLDQLHKRDQEYTTHVSQLKLKIDELERALSVSRASQAAQLAYGMVASTSATSAPTSTVSEPTTEHIPAASSSAHDISPALAYQPARRIDSASTTPTKSISATSATAQSSSPGLANTSDSSGTLVPHETSVIGGSLRTETKRAAPPKPTAQSDTEVEIELVCHHTLHHAEHLKRSNIKTAHAPSPPTARVTEPQRPAASTALRSLLSPASLRRHIRLPHLPHHRSHTLQSSEELQRPPPQDGLQTNGNATQDLEAKMILSEVETKPLAVLTWTCDDVCKYLTSLGMDKYLEEFTVNRIDGAKWLQMDGSKLKALGVQNSSDRTLMKKRIKELKSLIERERKQQRSKSRSSSATRATRAKV